MPDMVEVSVVPDTETLHTSVTLDTAGDDENIHTIPTALFDEYRAARRHLTQISDTIVAYTQGQPPTGDGFDTWTWNVDPAGTGPYLLRAIAAGRREYAHRESPVRAELQQEAELFELAARIAAGDIGPLYGLLPSWRWPDQMTNET